MECPERKKYRREWAREKYKRDPAKARAARKKSRENETSERRERRLANLKEYREKNRERVASVNKAWREANKSKIRESNLQRIGWSTTLFNQRLEEQNSSCAVRQRCLVSEPAKNVHADHCHESGIARGVLCHWCNVGIGCFGEDPVKLRSALAYLEKWKGII